MMSKRQADQEPKGPPRKRFKHRFSIAEEASTRRASITPALTRKSVSSTRGHVLADYNEDVKKKENVAYCWWNDHLRRSGWVKFRPKAMYCEDAGFIPMQYKMEVPHDGKQLTHQRIKVIKNHILEHGTRGKHYAIGWAELYDLVQMYGDLRVDDMNLRPGIDHKIIASYKGPPLQQKQPHRDSTVPQLMEEQPTGVLDAIVEEHPVSSGATTNGHDTTSVVDQPPGGPLAQKEINPIPTSTPCFPQEHPCRNTLSNKKGTGSSIHAAANQDVVIDQQEQNPSAASSGSDPLAGRALPPSATKHARSRAGITIQCKTSRVSKPGPRATTTASRLTANKENQAGSKNQETKTHALSSKLSKKKMKKTNKKSNFLANLLAQGVCKPEVVKDEASWEREEMERMNRICMEAFQESHLSTLVPSDAELYMS